jgi:predicted HTH transcriptional regulator
MAKIKIFISSVQKEFASEREALNEYILSDPLLGKFFEPFLFELLPALNHQPKAVYLKEVEESAVYLGLLGIKYGFEDKGVSVTEREFNHATLHHKIRLVFLSNHNSEERESKQNDFASKAQANLVRKRFSNIEELKSSVYSALVNYLIENGNIQTGPFDATTNPTAGLEDLDSNKIIDFVRTARSKRGFPLQESASVVDILTHLNLLNIDKISNAAILLFGKAPQRFFINSEVRCTYFHGSEVAKPIPSYKVFKGDVFELVDQTVDFVLSKLDFAIGTRSEETSIPSKYELPKEIVVEAIVNAIAHRDYRSNGSVQVMLFKNRLAVYNPGSLPMGWTTEKLKKTHTSIPANPLLAQPMYLKGYIERLGTGTADIVRIAKEEGLKEPEFIQDDSFTTILYRPSTDQATGQVTGQVTGQATDEIEKVVLVINGEMKRAEIQEELQLKHRENFVENYMNPALEEGFVEMKYPDIPNHPKQKYTLTKKGETLKTNLSSLI